MSQAPPPPPPGPAGPPSGLTPDERTWGGAAHWSSFVGLVLGGLSFLGPLLVLLLKGSTSPYVRRQAVESLNFQLSMFIYAAVSAVLLLVLIGLVLLPVVAVLWLVLTVLGSVRSADGGEYRYPLTIRMVS